MDLRINKLVDNIYIFQNNSKELNDFENRYKESLTKRYNGKTKEALRSFMESEQFFVETEDKKLRNIQYETYVNIALLTEQTEENFDIIKRFYEKAINIYGDRAEPFYYFSI